MRIGQVVIAGAGLAGLRTAEELRARGYQGALTMIGAEPRPPYDRPPLTKKFMTGEIDDTSLRADLTSLGTDLRLGDAATGLGAGVLRTGKAEFGFDALVIATGATPVRVHCEAPAGLRGCCAPSTTPPRCGRHCGPGSSWPSSAPAGSAPSLPPAPRGGAAR